MTTPGKDHLYEMYCLSTAYEWKHIYRQQYGDIRTRHAAIRKSVYDMRDMNGCTIPINDTYGDIRMRFNQLERIKKTVDLSNEPVDNGSQVRRTMRQAIIF